MTKHPCALETWLCYHRARCGIVAFYLRVEGCSDADCALLATEPWSECVHATFAVDSGATRHLVSQMDRQASHVQGAIEAAQRAGATHLLHIDDDELLHLPSGVASLHAALHGSADAADLHVFNLEALLPSPFCADPFRAARLFQHEPARFCSYRNGKSIGNLAVPTLCARAAHRFGAASDDGAHGSEQLPAHVAAVLHFESATFERWLDKWLELSARHAGEAREAYSACMPSAYYAASLKAADTLRRAEASGDAERAEAARRSALRLWCKHRLEPPSQLLPATPRAGVVRAGDGGAHYLTRIPDLFAHERPSEAEAEAEAEAQEAEAEAAARAAPPLFVHWMVEDGEGGVATPMRQGGRAVAVARGRVMTLSQLSHDPRVVRVAGFLSGAEAAALVRLATATDDEGEGGGDGDGGGGGGGGGEGDGWLRSNAVRPPTPTGEASQLEQQQQAAAEGEGGGEDGTAAAEATGVEEAKAAEVTDVVTKEEQEVVVDAPLGEGTGEEGTEGAEAANEDEEDHHEDGGRRAVRGRTSRWRFMGNEHELLAAAVERAAWLAGLSPEHAEACQVVHYSRGEEYAAHVDHFTRGSVRDAAALEPAGNRLVSLFVYLAAPPADGGGCTAFPLLGLAVPPTVGTALLWHNLDRHGLPDGRTLHCGEPVTRGEKLGMNIWLRQRPHNAEGVPRAAGGEWRRAPPPPCTATGSKAREAATLRERT